MSDDEKKHKKSGKKDSDDEVSQDKVQKKLLSLEKKLSSLRTKLGYTDETLSRTDKWSTTVFGRNLKCNKDVRVRVGPIIGKVTSTSAIVLLEVTLSAKVAIHLVPDNNQETSTTVSQIMPRNRPKAFLIENLIPNTIYHVCFEGINAKDARKRIGRVKTFPTDVGQLRVVALSCDRPERQKEEETNMWDVLSKQVLDNQVDVVLHLGDQVYGQDEFVDAQALLRYAQEPADPKTPEEFKEVRRLHKYIKDRMRDIYRFTWNMPFTSTVLAYCSNLMIWSDNDLYNDFTIAKEDGKPLEPIMIRLGQEVYREYQRQLWDANYDVASRGHSDEFHYHQWDGVGIMMMDMRGNRINCHGHQCIDNPIINDHQWATLDAALNDPTLKTLLVCSEIPFVEDDPDEALQKSTQKGLEFMKDHWSCNKTELLKLLDKVFRWKHDGNGERDFVLVAGDIHVGVDSAVKDNQTGETVRQLVCTPISNHVCDFFPKLEGSIDGRYFYTHTPLKSCRNYGYIVASVKGGKIDGKLVAGSACGQH